MSVDPAWIATCRFGLGAAPGELSRAGRSPRAWLTRQVAAPSPLPPALEALPASESIASELADLRRRGESGRRRFRARAREQHRVEARARLEVALGSERPFVERLVSFWADHFTVSALKPEVQALSGAFEREAVRPHVLGRFDELLIAVVRHPAMQLYLDNARSTGPASEVGVRRGVGLNENLAREILELHTLGVRGGYGQDDVIALAEVLTGWGMERRGRGRGITGRFGFAERRHQPGDKRLLGAVYGTGYAEGVRALGDLARHPATARHVATELARHFVADAPPTAAVDRLASAFERSGGDLAEVARALVELPSAWSGADEKLRSPWDLAVAAGRGLEVDRVGCRALLRGLEYLGQTPWTAPSPAGWPDEAAGWAGPEAVVRRVEWAGEAARRFAADVDVPERARDLLGRRLRPRTLRALKGAGDGRVAATLLLASPEFNRR